MLGARLARNDCVLCQHWASQFSALFSFHFHLFERWTAHTQHTAHNSIIIPLRIQTSSTPRNSPSWHRKHTVPDQAQSFRQIFHVCVNSWIFSNVFMENQTQTLTHTHEKSSRWKRIVTMVKIEKWNNGRQCRCRRRQTTDTLFENS